MKLEKQNVSDLEAPSDLVNIHSPYLISDALSLYRNLGEDYLWVDRLCIVQHDTEEKPGQIAAMDKDISISDLLYHSRTQCS